MVSNKLSNKLTGVMEGWSDKCLETGMKLVEVINLPYQLIGGYKKIAVW